MGIFQSFANFILRRKSNAKKKNASVNVNDLRIVKVYVNHKKDYDEYGNLLGMETVKAIPTFVLVEKKGDRFVAVPTSKNKAPFIISETSPELYDLVLKKTNHNNRYRKPFHLCPALDGKVISKDQEMKFAKMLSGIESDSIFFDQKDQENELKDICKQFNDMISAKRSDEVLAM